MAKYLDGAGLGILWGQIKSTFSLSTHNHDSAYVKIDGSTKMTGPLTIKSSINNNYNEGIRVEDAGNKWAGITLGATGTQGITPQSGEVAWFIAKRPGGAFIIAPNSSSNDTGLYAVSGGDIKWRTNIMLHLGNYTTYCATANHTHSTYLPKAQVSVDQSGVTWAQGYASSNPLSFVYNTYGAEYSYLIGMNSSDNYGTILKMGYTDKYLRILRKNNGGWQSTDWEKIYAGYADSAGSVSWDNITSKPSSFAPSEHTHAKLSFKDTSSNTVEYDGSTAINLTGGVNYASSSGTATTATKWAMTVLPANTDLNTLKSFKFCGNSNTSNCASFTNGPTGRSNGEMWFLTLPAGTESYGQQLYYSRSGTSWQLWTRTYNTTSFSDWVQFIHSGNYTTYAATANHDHDGTYLKLSGGTLSGSSNVLNITSNNSNSWIYYNTSGGQKASTGYWDGLAFVANENTYARIGVNDSGIPEYWPNSSGSNKQTLLHTGNYTTYCATSNHNHDSTYLKLNGTNVMTGDLNLTLGDVDRFVVFSYSGAINPTANSWRTGVLGTGSGEANYYVVQYQRINTSSATWNTAFKIGQDTGNVTFTNNIAIGNNTNIHSGNYTSYCATSGHNHDTSYVLKSGDTMTGALGITDSRNAWAMRSLQILAPNIGAGSAPMIQIGKADQEKDVGQVYFYYSGTSGSNNNRLSLGLHSQDDVLNIMGSGNVGIGTTAPDSKLHVIRNVNATNSPIATFENQTYSSSGSWCYGTDTYTPNLGNGGNVIHIFGKANSKYNKGYIGFHQTGDNSSSNFVTLGLYSSNNLVNILGTGDVGIGTTSPSAKLHVNGGLLSVTNNGNTLTIGSNNSSWCHFNSSAPFYFSTSVSVNGTLYPYTNGGSLGVAGNRWALSATSGNFAGQVTIQTQAKTKSSPVSQQLVINGPDYNESDTTSLQSAPGIGFHYPGRTWASLIWNGYFCGVSSDFSGYVSFKGSGFVKNGSDDSYVLLGGGGHKAETSLNAGSIGGYAHTAFVKKSDVVDSLRISYNALAAKYCAGTNPVYWRITIPKTDVWCMIQVTCSLIEDYNTGKNSKIVIYGTCYGSADWYGFRANVWGYCDETIKVYGAEKKYLYIYTNHAWETLSVDKIIVSDGITSQDISAVSIDWVSELPATYQTADTMYGLHTGNFSSYAAPASHTHSYLPLSGGAITGQITRDAGGGWISGRDNAIIKTTRTSASGSDWHPAVAVKTSAGCWTYGSVGGETLAFSYDTDANYNNGNNSAAVIYFPTAGSSGTLALTSDITAAVGSYLPLSGGWMDWGSSVKFKGLNGSTSAYGYIGYDTGASGYTMHCLNASNGYQSNGALYIKSNGCNGANDWGGIAIDNEGVTVFGAGDAGDNFTGVFRVLNEDNVADGPQFLVTKASGCTSKYSMTASSFIKSGGTSSQFLKADGSVDSTAYTSDSALTNSEIDAICT